MAFIPYKEGSTLDITAEEKKELGLKWRDVLYVIVALFLIFLLISPIPKNFETVGIGGIRVGTRHLIFLLLVLLYLQRTIVRFNEYERGVVLRMGKFDRIAGPGWAIIFPLLEKYYKVDLRRGLQKGRIELYKFIINT